MQLQRQVLDGLNLVRNNRPKSETFRAAKIKVIDAWDHGGLLNNVDIISKFKSHFDIPGSQQFEYMDLLNKLKDNDEWFEKMFNDDIIEI